MIPFNRSGAENGNLFLSACEIKRQDPKRGTDLISDALPFGRLWYTKPDDAIEYAKFRSRSHDAVIPVYDEAAAGLPTDLILGFYLSRCEATKPVPDPK